MFQRIARRHADRPDEPAADTAAESAPETPADGAPSAEAPADPAAQQPTTELPVGDRPTERIEAVASSAPPPAIDLTGRIPSVAPPAVHDTPSAQPAPAAQPAPSGESAPAAHQAPASGQAAAPEPGPRRPGFRARGRMRRRLRYLRKLRELQVRDLGGLVFDLRRFERTRDDLVVQKIDQIRACDDEVHALERALDERRDLRDVREPGIGGTCPRCFAIYGSADRFCSNCGAAFGGAAQGPAAQVPLAPPPTTSAPEASGAGPQA